MNKKKLLIIFISIILFISSTIATKLFLNKTIYKQDEVDTAEDSFMEEPLFI
ncbi:hypothetical protein [Staphylococcus phage LY01]|nr:hypothetical protein [Staphylococcus phage LY01]